MNGKKNGFGNAYGNESEALFDIPDTGIGVGWDYDAGTGLDNDTTSFQRGQATPKVIKPTVATRISRRRCLVGQRDSSKDDVASFTAQLASLSSLQRKKAIRNSPGASPKTRSPRNLRLKTPVPSPCRKDSAPSPLLKDNFESLLNDSTDNEIMIRCSQAVEEACIKGDKKSPMLPGRESRNTSLKRSSSGRTIASPLSRKRLLSITSPHSHKPDTSPRRSLVKPEVTENPIRRLPDITSSRSHEPDTSPLKPAVKPDLTENTISRLTENAVGSKQNVVKSADQCNNYVGSNFGFGEDDDIFMDFLDDCSKLDQSVQSTKSKSLALKDRSNTAVTANRLQEGKSTKSESVSSVQMQNNSRSSVQGNSTTGPTLNNGLQCKSHSSKDKTSTLNSGVMDRKSSESVDPLDDSDVDFDLSPALLNLLDGNINGGNVPAKPSSKDVPMVPIGKVPSKQPPTWTSNSKPTTKPTATATKQSVVPVQTVKPTIQSSSRSTTTSTADAPIRTGRLSIQQNIKSASEPIGYVTKQPVVPVQTGKLSKQQGELPNSAPTVALPKHPAVQTSKPSVQPMVKSSTISTVSVTRSVVQTGKISIQQSIKTTSVSTVSVPKQPVAPLQPIQSVQPSVKPSLAPVRKCTPEEIERKRQEALQKLKRQALRR